MFSSDIVNASKVIFCFFEFFFIGVEHIQDACRLGVENADQIAGGSLKNAEQHGPEDVLGGQFGDLADRAGIEHSTFDECTFRLDFIALLAELEDQFGHGAAVTLAVHHGGVAGKVGFVDAGNVQSFRRLENKGILQNVAAAAQFRQLIPEIGEILDLDSGIVDKEDVIGIGNHAADRFDQKDLFVSHFAAFTSSLRLIFKPGVMVAEMVQLKR